MITPARIVSTVWLIWLIAWILAARFTAKTVARQSISSRLAHALPLAAGAFLLFIHPPPRGILTRPVIPSQGWRPWAGAILTLVGLSWSVWARAHLGRLWSGTVTLKADHAIIRSGPYAMTRHPIYTGLLIALIGSTVLNATQLGLIGLVLLVFGLHVKIRQEEQLLLGHFGDAYRAYQR